MFSAGGPILFLICRSCVSLSTPRVLLAESQALGVSCGSQKSEADACRTAQAMDHSRFHSREAPIHRHTRDGDDLRCHAHRCAGCSLKAGSSRSWLLRFGTSCRTRFGAARLFWALHHSLSQTKCTKSLRLFSPDRSLCIEDLACVGVGLRQFRFGGGYGRFEKRSFVAVM
ncbi:hypothetical protein GGD50_005889 [Rhizobium paranaense]|uniref:Uncharacterized protein n=1 Tax=Rhizobium paranaense TaxID=1650438 RepID=A0A7W8XX87_9HYPH|nr:hypothetical protein [Rhizobium paranaense]